MKQGYICYLAAIQIAIKCIGAATIDYLNYKEHTPFRNERFVTTLVITFN